MTKAFRLAAFSVIVICIFLGLNSAFYYEDKSIWSTDARVEAYKKLPENSMDVLFVGSSNVMSGINPVQLWEETGIQSYNYCSRAQTFPFSYAFLQEALKTQTPEYVILDIYSVILDKPLYGISNLNSHLNMNLDALSLDTRYPLISELIPIEDQLFFYVPLLRHHSYYKTWSSDETDETNLIFMV